MKKILLGFSIFALIFCGLFTTQVFSENELTVFSGRKEPLIRPVIDLFEKETGIKVILKTGNSIALAQQILQELPKSSADIYIAKESGSLEFLRLKGGLQSFNSEVIELVPAKLRARDGSWVGVSGRSRALIYNLNEVSSEEVPQTLEELLNPKWKGKIAAVNSGNESFVAWVSALRLQLGDDETKRILKGLKSNEVALLSGSHTDVRKAVGRGEYALGLINHYYYHLQKHEIDSNLTNVGIVYLDQAKSQRGEIINVSGAGIVKGSPNLKEAQVFLNFLLSEKAQELFANVNYEYPLVQGVATNPEVLSALNCTNGNPVSCIKEMDVYLDQLGSEIDQTMDLLDEVAWY